jgi:hypothetical protein
VELPSRSLGEGIEISSGTGLWVVKFYAPERAGWARRVDELGLRYVQYVPHNAALVSCGSMWGNNILASTETTAESCYLGNDFRNNVETVIIPPYSGSSFTIYVCGQNIPQGQEQAYAIFALNAY